MKISQTEARRLRAKVRKLEQERTNLYSAWTKDQMIAAVYLGESVCSAAVVERIRAVRWLNHAVTVIASGDKVEFYATREVF